MRGTKWLSEIRATRRSLAEIGLLIIVREIFKNKLEMTVEEANSTLGTNWMTTAQRLKKDGLLQVAHDGLYLRMWVDAPGDKKRERCRRLMARLCAIRRLEARYSREAAEAKAKARSTAKQEASLI